MPERWTEKDVLEYARELKSPFDIKQNGQNPLPDLTAQVEEMIRRNKGMTPK